MTTRNTGTVEESSIGSTDDWLCFGRRSLLKLLGTGGVLTLGSGIAATSGNDEDEDDGTGSANRGHHEGESTAVGDGEVTAYVTTTPMGAISSLGVHIDGDAMEVFGDEEVVANLDFPTETTDGAELDTHQFTYLRFEYLPEGHIPKGVYDVPHFDFIFFMLDEETVEGIEARPAQYSIPEAQMPTDHIRPPLADTNGDGEPDAPLVEPKLGEPITDPAFPEYQEDGEFTQTHLYGAYDPDGDGVGELMRFEPMITAGYVDRVLANGLLQGNVPLDIGQQVELKTPAEYATADEYPTAYVLRPDGDGGLFVSLEDFEAFPGPSE